MGIIRIILRKNSILENNLVQTIGSAGESVAAGAIFTLPALFLWAKEGKIDSPSILSYLFSCTCWWYPWYLFHGSTSSGSYR